MLAFDVTSSEKSGWNARLNLVFERFGERTVLSRREHSGPVRVQRPFYPEGEDACHVYLLHPPGGLVGGDTVQIRIDARDVALALLTTPAAAKFYRSAGRLASQEVELHVGAGASCEWLPQETIVFGGANARSRTRVILARDARFAGWEITCLGRPAAGDRFETGNYHSAFEIWRREGSAEPRPCPLLVERAVFDAGCRTLNASWGLRGCTVAGTFVITATDPELVAALRSTVMTESESEYFAVSGVEGLTVCRYLGHSSQRALHLFGRAWSLVRPRLLGRPASPPRIWLT